MCSSKARVESLGRGSCKALALTVAIAACLPNYGTAAEPATKRETIVTFSIPAGDLSVALERFSTQSDIQVMYRQELVSGKRVNALNGAFDPRVALEKLLGGTGLMAEHVNRKTYVLKLGATESPRKTNGQQKGTDAGGPKEEVTDGVNELEKIVVVGSRLQVNPTDASLPIKVISRDDIDRSGVSTIAQMLNYLPEVSMNNSGDTNIGAVGGHAGGLEGSEINASTVQLRGLPLGTTLILINGRRSGESSALASSGQFDLNTIPLAMVERIEVLPAGSSALYGGDGLSGVVNIVLRRDATGLEARINHKTANGYAETNASFVWGRSWSRGAVTTTATWKKNNALESAERKITSDYDFTRYGGLDYRNAGYSYPATVYSLEGCDLSIGYCLLPLEQRGNLPGLDAPVAVVPGGQDGKGLTPSDFLTTQGQMNLSSPRFNIYSPGRTSSVGFNGEFALNPSTRLVGEFMYTDRTMLARQLGLSINNGQYGFQSAVVTAANPFNPFGVDVGIDYTFSNTNLYREYEQKHVRALVALSGKRVGWDWEIASWWSRDKSTTGEVLSFASYYYPDALGATEPSKALNPFTGDGSAPGSEALLSTLSVPMDSDFGNSVFGFSGFVRGNLFNLPAGPVLGVAGAEYSKQKLISKMSNAGENVAGDDVNRAMFGEIRAPILPGNTDGTSQRLVATGAVRIESTERFQEHAVTETIGLELRPVKPIMLRGTYSTAFKPLGVYQASTPVEEYSGWVQDPAMGGAAYIVPRIIYGGGIPPGLKPERSTSRTLGVIYAPSTDLRLSVTAWKTEVEDLLYLSPWGELVLEYEDDLAGRVTRDPTTGFVTEIDTRAFNISETDTAGYDLAFDLRWRALQGDFTSSTAATHVIKHRQRFSEASPAQDNLGIVRSTGWSPSWKFVQRLGWSLRDDVHLTLVGRYVNTYKSPDPLQTGPDAGRTQRLGDFWMFDMNADLAVGKWVWSDTRVLAGARLSIGATNLLDRLPDFCNSCLSPVGYDASQYDVVGRTVYAELRFNLW